MEELSKALQASANQRDKYASTMVEQERSFADYAQVFGLNEPELQGRQILDLGSGRLSLFSREAEKKGVTVTSVSPDLKNKALRREATLHKINGLPYRFWERRRRLPPRVAALSQYLPFKEESFDIVTAFLSVPQYLPDDQEEVKKSFAEMMRVLKPNGSIHLVYWPNEAGTKEGFIQQEFSRLLSEGSTVSQHPEENIEGNPANIVKIIKA